jgi:hypothetical protein
MRFRGELVGVTRIGEGFLAGAGSGAVLSKKERTREKTVVEALGATLRGASYGL